MLNMERENNVFLGQSLAEIQVERDELSSFLLEMIRWKM